MASKIGSSFQLADAPLVSNYHYRPQPYATAPAKYTEAISVLQREDDRDIVAWLKLARSLGPTLQCHIDQERLTREQVRAIGTLRHCEDDDIIARLHLARTPSVLGIPAISASSSAHNPTLKQEHTAPFVPSDACISDLFDCSSTCKPDPQASTQVPSAQPLPPTTVPPSQAQPKYCCTLCGYHRPFKNQSDWKKHEKEHDTTYRCMPRGPRENTPQGSRCAFCGLLYPSDAHLLEHKTRACLQGALGSFSSKRRHEMVSHLSKAHGVHDKHRGEAIAVKWKDTLEKQAWSCGFCVIVFATFSDRLSHIAAQHFENGQAIDAWDSTKVIQGLLQQPGMVTAWKEKLASLSPWEAKAMIWEKDAITNLQHDLEVGPNDERSAADLAEAAYNACRLNWGIDNQQAMAVNEARSDEMSATALFSPGPQQESLADASMLDFDHSQSLSAIREFNGTSSSDPPTHVTSPLGYSYSSIPMDGLKDIDNIGLAPSSFHFQQTESVNAYSANGFTGNGELGKDKGKRQVHLRNVGTNYETGFSNLFN